MVACSIINYNSAAVTPGIKVLNLEEGAIDGHLRGIHHVVERLGVSVPDYAFLDSGVGLILLGWPVIRCAAGEAAAQRDRPADSP